MIDSFHQISPHSTNGKAFDVEKEKERLTNLAGKVFSESEHFKATGLDPNNFVFNCQREVMDGELNFFFEVYTKSPFPTKDFDLIQEAIEEVRRKVTSGGKNVRSIFQLDFTNKADYSNLVPQEIIRG